MSVGFDDNEKGIVVYSPQANRIFILNSATFFQLPSLERGDGKKLILPDFETADAILRSETNDNYHLERIGEL